MNAGPDKKHSTYRTVRTDRRGRPEGAGTAVALPKEKYTGVLDGVATVFQRRFYDAFIPNARCYEEEKNLFKALCREKGVSMGDYIRSLVLDELEANGYSLGGIVTSFPIAQWIDGKQVPYEGEEVIE